MAGDETSPSWILWIRSRGFVAFAVLAISAMIITILMAYHFERRIDSIETTVPNPPPRRFQAIDPATYSPGDVQPDQLTMRQTVYLPIYSHVYYDGGRPQLVETTVSIRNTDLTRPIYVRSVEYFDTKGDLVNTYLDQMCRIAPLETIEFLVKAKDTEGGSGANFIIDWGATEDVEKPIIEAIMVGMIGPRAFSFVRNGYPLKASDASP